RKLRRRLALLKAHELTIFSDTPVVDLPSEVIGDLDLFEVWHLFELGRADYVNEQAEAELAEQRARQPAEPEAARPDWRELLAQADALRTAGVTKEGGGV